MSLVFTNEVILNRISEIELKLNEMQKAMNNLASNKTLKNLLNIRQNEIVDLQSRVQALETQLVALQAQVNSLL